tara:strand:+ start:117 stop:254 length:138 start_codon:yes stop_codon:yes gene_type:complete
MRNPKGREREARSNLGSPSGELYTIGSDMRSMEVRTTKLSSYADE